MANTIPSDSYAAGDTGHITDHNNISDVLTYQDSGVLLASVCYGPATNAAYTTTSATPAAVDSTNLTASFTVPRSGKVLVRLSAPVYISSAVGFWCVMAHGGAQVGQTMFCSNLDNSEVGVSAAIRIGSLTPGASLQYDWGFFCNGTAMVMPVQGGTGVTSAPGGPAVMEVWSA